MRRFLAPAGILGTFGALAVMSGPVFGTLDVTLLVAANEIRQPVYDRFFRGVTWLGSLWLLLPLALAYAGSLRLKIALPAAGFVPIALLGTSLVSHVLKALIDRERPDLYPPLTAMPTDASFPSAHTAQVVAALLAVLLQPGITRSRCHGLAAMLAGLVVVLAVAASRIYLQVHFATDVVAGVLIGLAVVLILRGLPWWEVERR